MCFIARHTLVVHRHKRLGEPMTSNTLYFQNIYRSKVIALPLLCLLAACNTTSLMEIPQVEQVSVEPLTNPTMDQASFVLSKVVANIRRGTPILHYPAEEKLAHLKLKGTLCNYRYQDRTVIEWGTGSSVLGDWRTELGEVFYEAMSNAGFNVAGDPTDMFGRSKSAQAAEYQVGARVTEIRGNLCDAHDWWDGHPLWTTAGEMYVNVEWSVYSNLAQKQIFKVVTEGYHKEVESKRNAIMLLLQNAFASATEAFAVSQQLKDVALRVKKDSKEEVGFSGSTITLQTSRLRKAPIKDQMATTLSSVVTVRVGQGHGSGFAISEDGHILTNAHVVGNSSKAAVVLNNGLEISGEVLRKSEIRDIALVKVPLRFPSPLPIRTTPPVLLEKVYAVGSPKREALHSTVTTGIVSAMRGGYKAPKSLIQSDAAISPGNSGGPLIDENGNVIGISVLKYIGTGAEGLNLFIPIISGLEAIKIQTETPE